MAPLSEYFDGCGRGEKIRLCFHANKVAFEDIRVPAGDWFGGDAKQKINPPFGALPFLEKDGKKYSDSGAILRYLCQTFGNYPTNTMDIYRTEMVADYIEDFFKAFVPIIFEQHPEKKQALIHEYYTKKVPDYMSKLNTLLKENKNHRYFVADKLTLGDFAVLGFISVHCYTPELAALTKEGFIGAPELTAYWVYHQETFKDYLATRPKSAF